MIVSRLLKSCAMPPVSWPMASSRCDLSTASFCFNSSVTSRSRLTTAMRDLIGAVDDGRCGPGREMCVPSFRRRVAEIGVH